MPGGIDAELFNGLRELVESVFPKRCRNCGRIYQSAAEFLEATRPLRTDCSGLKPSQDDDGQSMVELYRNCACGSTLMELFRDRRDLSEAGMKRRARFQDMYDKLVALGCPADVAREELLKLVRGQPNALVELVRRHSNNRSAARAE